MLFVQAQMCLAITNISSRAEEFDFSTQITFDTLTLHMRRRSHNVYLFFDRSF